MWNVGCQEDASRLRLTHVSRSAVQGPAGPRALQSPLDFLDVLGTQLREAIGLWPLCQGRRRSESTRSFYEDKQSTSTGESEGLQSHKHHRKDEVFEGWVVDGSPVFFLPLRFSKCVLFLFLSGGSGRRGKGCQLSVMHRRDESASVL